MYASINTTHVCVLCVATLLSLLPRRQTQLAGRYDANRKACMYAIPRLKDILICVMCRNWGGPFHCYAVLQFMVRYSLFLAI